MKMSCNGCRVLRKGCSENCSLRPCLQWIKTPESQANATVFLAKFYGRAGLINLINAGPDHLRPDIFKSLLYEACGRIINPVHGSVGLMCSGNWQRVLEAVEAVLKGTNIMQFPMNNEEDSTSDEVPHQIMPFKGCDIRHLSKNSSSEGPVHHVKIRNRYKRRATKANTMISVPVEQEYVTTNEPSKFSITGWDFDQLEEELKRAPSHDSFSVETVEPSLVNQAAGPVLPMKLEEVGELGLELTLGLMT